MKCDELVLCLYVKMLKFLVVVECYVFFNGLIIVFIFVEVEYFVVVGYYDIFYGVGLVLNKYVRV